MCSICKILSSIKYIKSIEEIPTAKSYWKWEQFVNNEGNRNVMARSRFEYFLQNLHFLGNTKMIEVTNVTKELSPEF